MGRHENIVCIVYAKSCSLAPTAYVDLKYLSYKTSLGYSTQTIFFFKMSTIIISLQNIFPHIRQNALAMQHDL
jgi:hypothetical protein